MVASKIFTSLCNRYKCSNNSCNKCFSNEDIQKQNILWYYTPIEYHIYEIFNDPTSLSLYLSCFDHELSKLYTEVDEVRNNWGKVLVADLKTIRKNQYRSREVFLRAEEGQLASRIKLNLENISDELMGNIIKKVFFNNM